MTDWKSIESAPKDGTDIIVYRPNFDGTYIPQVGSDYWSSKLNCWAKSRRDTPPIAWQPMPQPPWPIADALSCGKCARGVMKYNGIMWGPSMRGYLADNKVRINRCESSLRSLKNQDGQYARDHRMLIELFREIDTVLAKHIELADSAVMPPADRGGSE